MWSCVRIWVSSCNRHGFGHGSFIFCFICRLYSFSSSPVFYLFICPCVFKGVFSLYSYSVQLCLPRLKSFPRHEFSLCLLQFFFSQSLISVLSTSALVREKSLFFSLPTCLKVRIHSIHLFQGVFSLSK